MTRSCFSLDMDTFEQTKDAIRNDPNLGKGTFSAVTEWVDGSLARTTARSFTIDTDEPTPLGGTDKAIDPMELLLAAVGTCLQIGWVTHANRRGVDFRALRIETRGDYDLQGYMALDPNLPPGFLNISYTVEVDSDADPATLEEIRVAAENGSPVAQKTSSTARPSAPRSGWRQPDRPATLAEPAPVGGAAPMIVRGPNGRQRPPRAH